MIRNIRREPPFGPEPGVTVEGSQRHGRRKAVRYGIIAGVLALIVTSVVFAVEDSGGSPKLVLMNVPVPRFSLPSVVPDTPGISPASFEGRAVVLNFWASWCPPCQAEMPTFQAAHRALGDQVTFIGVDEQDTRPSAIAFLRHVGVTYGNGFDSNGAVSRAFSLDGTPETYFISHGEELDLNLGAVSAATLRSDLRELFGVQWSPAGAAA
jgi:cytochrome c biogenesis protein CcmG/thiol:disulfide interchange protein DsbE